MNFKNTMDEVFYQMPSRRTWISEVQYVGLQPLSPNSWLECNVTVSKEAACRPGSRVSTMMQLLLARGEPGEEKLWGKTRIRPKENVSQNSRTPHPLIWITKPRAWQPVEAQVGAEGWTGARLPLQKAAPAQTQSLPIIFIGIIKWVFKGKDEYVNHNGARRKESINLLVNSQILKNYFKY